MFGVGQPVAEPFKLNGVPSSSKTILLLGTVVSTDGAILKGN
jgi:hypothetical protein